ncbi:hypothetical protein [Corallococcus sp. EGB]|uniref:hypothetical protein n=1 Tax=Corallococcus sp. EGB TaxID=1521117 RepID=UPI001CBB16C2|nr:hypothetical protein [Corallococcus sp. EGB]
MHIESSRGTRSSKVVTFLRIPVLVAVGLVTMGSGMVSPGCGGSSTHPDGEDGCAISGTYAVQLADTSPPGEGCEALGERLPTGPLVLNLSAGSYVTGKFGDDSLSTDYYGEPFRELEFGTMRNLSEQVQRTFSIEATVRAPAPRTDTDASTLEGRYEAKLTSVDGGSVKCLIQRDFTATR